LARALALALALALADAVTGPQLPQPPRASISSPIDAQRIGGLSQLAAHPELFDSGEVFTNPLY